MRSLVKSLLFYTVLIVGLPIWAQPVAPYCAANGSTDRGERPVAQQRQWDLIKRGQAIQGAIDNKASWSTIRSDLERYRDQIYQFLASAEIEDMGLARPAVILYFSIARQYIQKALVHNPGTLSSLTQYNSWFNISLSPEAVLALFPTFDSPPQSFTFSTDLQNPGAKIITISETSILRDVIHGMGRSSQAVEKKYFDTSRCLLAATQASKLAFHQILTGDLRLNFKGAEGEDYGDKKVCGQLTVRQLGEAYLREHGRAPFETYKRKALYLASPRLELFLPTSFFQLMEREGIENSGYLDPYIFNEPVTVTSGRNESMSQYIKDQLTQGMNRLNEAFSIDSLRPLLLNPEVQAGVEALINNCELEIDLDIENSLFFEQMARAERVLFSANLADVYESLPYLVSRQPDQSLDQVLRDVLYRVRYLAAAEALSIGLSHYERDTEISGILPAVNEFTNRTLKGIASQDIRENAEQHRPLIDTILARYRSQLKLAAPLTDFRQNFQDQLLNAAEQLNEYDQIDINAGSISTDSLPFRRSIILNIYSSTVDSLSPHARGLAEAIFGETDFAKAKDWWQKTNEFFREDLAELQLGHRVFTRSNWQSSARGFLRKLYGNPAQEGLDRAQFIQTDYQNLKYLAERIGLLRSTPPQTLHDVLLEQGKTGAEMRSFIDTYRNLLKVQLFATYRILEMPYPGTIENSEPFYKSIAGLRENQPSEHLVNGALGQLIPNIRQHLNVIAKATSKKDLRPYITRSYVLNTLLGEDDLSMYALRADFWPSIQDIGAFGSGDTYVFPDLIAYHQELKADWTRKEDRSHRRWDEFYDTVGIATLPLLGAWGMKAFFPFLPKALGGSLIPRNLTFAADRTLTVIDHYWNAIIGLMLVDLGVQTGRYFDAAGEVAQINEMAYSEGIFVEGIEPLIDRNLLEQQKRFYAQRQDAAFQRGLWNGIFLGGILAATPIMRYYYAKVKPLRMARKQTYYDDLLNNGRRSEALNLENKYQAGFTRKMAREAKRMGTYFRHLKVPEGTWRIVELDQALKVIRDSGKTAEIARAEVAYEKLIEDISKHYLPIQEVEVLRQAFIDSIWKSEDEAIRFVQSYKRISEARNGTQNNGDQEQSNE